MSKLTPFVFVLLYCSTTLARPVDLPDTVTAAGTFVCTCCQMWGILGKDRLCYSYALIPILGVSVYLTSVLIHRTKNGLR